MLICIKKEHRRSRFTSTNSIRKQIRSQIRVYILPSEDRVRQKLYMLGIRMNFYFRNMYGLDNKTHTCPCPITIPTIPSLVPLPSLAAIHYQVQCNLWFDHCKMISNYSSCSNLLWSQIPKCCSSHVNYHMFPSIKKNLWCVSKLAKEIVYLLNFMPLGMISNLRSPIKCRCIGIWVLMVFMCIHTFNYNPNWFPCTFTFQFNKRHHK